jgi:hypothetical protein
VPFLADKKLTSTLVELVKEIGKDIKEIKKDYLTKSEFSNFESDVKLKYVSKTTYESDKLNFVDKSTYESEMQEIKTALTQITSV